MSRLPCNKRKTINNMVPHATSVIPIDRDPLRAVGGDLIEPIDYRGVTAMLFN